jgi:hypothetical protein
MDRDEMSGRHEHPFLIFRVGLDNDKIERNPAVRIRKKTEGGGRVRFLSDPAEKRLRAAIERRFAEFASLFALNPYQDAYG